MSLTPGNVDDRKPVVDLLKDLWGKVFGDRGYVSQKLATKLLKDFGPIVFCQTQTQYEEQINEAS